MTDDFPCESFKTAAAHLRRPFTSAAVKFKPQSVLGEDGKGVLCVAYIDARLVYERLNLVVPHLWQHNFRPIGDGLMWCDLTVDGITRPDVGEGKGKALASDALKRAAVTFGIGVSLYAIPQQKIWKDVGGGKLVSIWPSGTKPNGKPKFDARIEDDGQAFLRGAYEKWLSDVGRKAFGDPLDHGDSINAQGDAEAEHPVGVDRETGEVSSSAPDVATPAQLKFLRTLITRNRVTPEIMARLFESIDFGLEASEKVNDAVKRLTRGQCSSLIEFIQDGAIKTGESDVPSDGDFTHPPAADDDLLPATMDVGPS